MAGSELLLYTRARVRSVLVQIDQLGESEFPYPHSRDALQIIKDLFLDISSVLHGLDEKSNPIVLKTQCGLALRALFRYLPRLGFILRSTNVRNAFEIFGPLLRIAREVLEPGVKEEERTTKLVLSSEWTYSPVTYPQASDLPGVVFIGIPAPESANPLLIPLAGHELGHAIWTKEKLNDSFKPDVKNRIIEYIKDHWQEYKTTFPYVSSPEDLTTDMFAQQSWAPALTLTLRHAQETFCDFVGLRVFGQAFLQAYAYLLAPNVPLPRSLYYPRAMKRVRNLIATAAKDEYKVTVPEGYEDLFQDPPEPNVGQADQYRMMVADNILDDMTDALAVKADEVISRTAVGRPNEGETLRIYDRFKLVVPATRCASLADILNAAWVAFGDPSLWANIPQISAQKDVVLPELVLKNIEIFEVEQLLGGKQ